MNTGASWPSLDEARARVLGIQTKLHQWSSADAQRRFDDLYNLVSRRFCWLGGTGSEAIGAPGLVVWTV